MTIVCNLHSSLVAPPPLPQHTHYPCFLSYILSRLSPRDGAKPLFVTGATSILSGNVKNYGEARCTIIV